MKITKRQTSYIIAGLILFFSASQNIMAQVARYDKTLSVGHNTFNYPDGNVQMRKIRKNKDVRIVFSDRDNNKAYADPYAQRVLSEQKIGSSFYVIDEKNGFCKVVSANQNFLGKPKGMFATFHSSKNHFKDARNLPFVGWIEKNCLLEFNHSFVSEANNFPIRYRIGASSISRLSNLRTFFVADTLHLYNDPFFLTQNGNKVTTGQIVYAYKYDASKQAVLISDRPSLTDSTQTALGWAPADLVSMVGQNHVYLLGDTEHPNFYNLQLGSNLLFTADGNWGDTSSDHKIAVNVPLSVWDREKSMMLNVKGEDVPVATIDQLIENCRNMNIHLIFYDKDRLEVRNLVNALQGLNTRVPQDSRVNFSLTSVSENGNKHLASTSDFGKWVDFLVKVTSSNTVPESAGSGFHEAMRTIFSETPYVKFENNIFLILGTNEFPTFTSDINAEIYTRSATILLAQILGKDSEAYQNFILQSKELLDNNISEYMNFTRDYLSDPNWTKAGSFTDISTESENVYLLDAPKNSIVAGGFVYPKLNNVLSGAGFSRVLDSLFVQIAERNKKLVATSQNSENRYGVLRAIPTQEIVNLCNNSAISVEDLEKNNIHDVFFKKMSFDEQQLASYDEGYLFDTSEMKSLLENCRSMMPYLPTDSLGKKELSVLRENYKSLCNLVNQLSYRKVLTKKSAISKIHYHRVGIPSSDALNYVVRIKDIRRKKCDESEWDKCYKDMYDRLVGLEKLFKSNRLRTVSVAGKPYYFVPIKAVP